MPKTSRGGGTLNQGEGKEFSSRMGGVKNFDQVWGGEESFTKIWGGTTNFQKRVSNGGDKVRTKKISRAARAKHYYINFFTSKTLKVSLKYQK